MFEDALSAGLTASGADVYLLHVTTTPSVSYITRTEDFDCGIMISASHNPFYDNGIKLINAQGQKMEAEVEAKIEAYIDGEMEEIPYARREKIGRTVDYSAGRNRYIGRLITLATRSFKGKKVGLDCSNGSAYAIAKSVFDALGAKTSVINAAPDGLNINVDSGSTHIEALVKHVRENHLDVGFAFDGDADRCIAVDECGEVVNGDHILYILADAMKQSGELENNTVVTTVMSNLGLYRALETAGIAYEKTAVGDRFVYESMQRNGYTLGGEQSGHIIIGKYATTGDGIITAIKLMEAIIDSKKSLAALSASVKMLPQITVNVRVADKESVNRNERVLGVIKYIEEQLGRCGRILVRASGTEPVIRVMVESDEESICRKFCEMVVSVFRAEGLEKNEE
jgi:phosphoglucosamine mutase